MAIIIVRNDKYSCTRLGTATSRLRNRTSMSKENIPANQM